MAFLRKRGTKFSLSFKWNGEPYIKALGTSNEREAKQIKQDAEDQLKRIKEGKSPVAAKLLAEGFSIVDVLFGSPDVAARLDLKPEDNPMTIGDLLDGFLPVVRARVGFNQTANTESWTKKLRGHFDENRRVMTLSLGDLDGYRKRRVEKDGVGVTSINKELSTLRSAIKWAMEAGKLPRDPIGRWPSLKTKRQKRFEWKSDIDAQIAQHEFKNDDERQTFLKELSVRMVLTADDIQRLVKLAKDKMPELVLPLMVVCSTGIRRKELAMLLKQDFEPRQGTIIVGSKKQSRTEDVTYRTIVLRKEVATALRDHHKSLPRSETMLLPIFGEIDVSYSNRWIEYQTDAKGNQKIDADGKKIPKRSKQGNVIPSKRKLPEDQRRAEKAGRLLDRLVDGTEFELMNGWHCLRHSFISICVANGLTWEQIRGWVGHVSPETTNLYTHFNLTDSKQRMESLGIRF